MSAGKVFTVGGIGAQPTLDDVVTVALGHAIGLDAAGSDRIKKESPAPKAFQAETFTPAEHAAPAECLSTVHTRAVLITRLLTVMNGKTGCRLQVADFLASLLNQGISPCLPVADDDAAVLEQVANSCHGAGHANVEGDNLQPLAAALEAKGVKAPGLSSAERSVLQAGSVATAGISAITVQAGKKLLSAATAVAALSCEALGVQTKAFESDVVEAQGYKAAVAVADELQSLLEGSKRANTLKGGEELVEFVALPQRLGALADSLAGAYTATRSEVQSGALLVKGASSSSLQSPSLPANLVELARALLLLARGAAARAQRVGQALPGVMALAPQCLQALEAAQAKVQAAGQRMLQDVQALPGVQVALAASSALSAAQQAVALEALAALAALRLLEGPPAPAQPAAAPEAAAPEAAAPAAENKAKAQDGKKKERVKGGAGGVVLGKGSVVARAQLERVAAGGEDSLPLADGALAPALDLGLAWCSLCGALDPLGPACGRLLGEVKAVVEANQARRKPKVAKGARDFLPDQMAIREAAFGAITQVFKRHGAVSIDTPVFELRETLMGKYGEDSKLIYDLADQGGELLSLRYDLTVPFARYVAVNSVGNIKRYHIGKVYRRDQPQMNRGRFREFFQCDFDVAGSYSVMVADAEVLTVLVEILTNLKLGAFEVKINHRRLLDAMLQIAGVPPQKFRAICSAIDKLDKEPWSAVREEMVGEKGLPEAVADKIGEFVVLRGQPYEMLEKLTAPGHALGEHPDSRAALEEMRTLFGYLQAMGSLAPITFDLSLARGLDYYTGVIYEAVLQGGNVGSIAAGGRYDKLVGMFSGKDVPAVGVSIGIERVFAIMEAQMRERAAASGKPIRATETEVLVCSIGNNMQVKRMEVCSQLWASSIKAEFGFKPNPKMGDQLNYCLEQAIPFMVLFGEEELNAGNVKIKDMDAKTEDVVPLTELVAQLKQRIAAKQQQQA